jgi:Methyltransferase domain
VVAVDGADQEAVTPLTRRPYRISERYRVVSSVSTRALSPAILCAESLQIGQCGAGDGQGTWGSGLTSLPDRRASLWAYYDRRAPEYTGGVEGAYRYFRGVGVDVDREALRAELRTVIHQLAQLSPCDFVDVGAGLGVFTSRMPGSGFAIDQSENVLRRLRATVGAVPVIRADATALPLRANAVTRLFAGHLYGHLEPSEAARFLVEARRVADELVILDSGHPPGAPAEAWQTRSLADGSTHTVYKRHLDVDVLLAEVGGDLLFGGDYYVLVRSIA